MVEPVALLHQRETCTYGPISPPLTGSVGTRERRLQVSLLCKLHSEYGGLTVKVVVEHLEEGHRSYTENIRNQSCKLEN